jgi:hypothetical protein
MSSAKLLKGDTRIKSGYDGKRERQAKLARMGLDPGMTNKGRQRFRNDFVTL